MKWWGPLAEEEDRLPRGVAGTCFFTRREKLVWLPLPGVAAPEETGEEVPGLAK